MYTAAQKVSQAKYNAANREKRKAYLYAWRKQNKDKLHAIDARYRECNADKHRASSLRYRNEHLEASRQRVRDYQKANSDKINALCARRRAAKIRRTPGWVDFGKIENVYAEAKAMSSVMGEPWHVDHVIPLQGKRVSGLHVHTNLQILPGVENIKKSNNFDPQEIVSCR